MRKGLLFSLLLAVTCSAAPELPPGIKVFFGGPDSLEQELVRVIDAANTEVLFSQHAITNHRIAEAIVRAFQVRKLYVAGLLDRAPPVATNYTTPEYFAINGLPVAVSQHANHARYLVVDRQIVVVGSSDWTVGGLTRTNDNLLVLSEPSIADVYRNRFVAEFSKGKRVAVPESPLGKETSSVNKREGK